MANSNYKKYKKKNTDAKKIAIGVGAILLAGALTAGVLCMGYASRNDKGKWFGNSNLATWHWNDKLGNGTIDAPDDKEKEPVEAVDLIFSEDENDEVPMKVTFNRIAPLSRVMEMSMPEDEHKSYLVTAKCIPEETTDSVDMSLSWSNDVEWQNKEINTTERGEDVNTYVKLEHDEGAKTGTVTFLKEFHTTIKLTVKSKERSVSKDVNIDYLSCPGNDFYVYTVDTRGESTVGVNRTTNTDGEFMNYAVQNFNFAMTSELGVWYDEFYGSIIPSRVEADVTYSVMEDLASKLPGYEFKTTTETLSFKKLSLPSEPTRLESDFYSAFGGSAYKTMYLPLFNYNKPDGVRVNEYKDYKFLQYVYGGDHLEDLQREISLLRNDSSLSRTELGQLAIIKVRIDIRIYVNSGGQELLVATDYGSIWVGFRPIAQMWTVPMTDVDPGNDLVFW